MIPELSSGPQSPHGWQLAFPDNSYKQLYLTLGCLVSAAVYAAPVHRPCVLATDKSTFYACSI